jgi:ketosteroid isomerase-like protein
MSRQNEQVARRAYDAFSRGDFEAFAALLHPEVEFESLLLEMEAGSYRGLEGAREYFESVREVFPDWSVEITGLDDFGDRVVIESRSVATGKGSGVRTEQRFWQVAALRDGRIIWWKFFRSRDEALEAVALDERSQPCVERWDRRHAQDP